MRWILDWVGGTARLAWWDGSCLDLRLHRLGDLIDFVATPPETTRAYASSRAGASR